MPILAFTVDADSLELLARWVQLWPKSLPIIVDIRRISAPNARNKECSQTKRSCCSLALDFPLTLGSPSQAPFKMRCWTCTDPLEEKREEFISAVISSFWKAVFGWSGSEDRPALEDHFTQIDMAANTGHYLWKMYGPKRLRALRRITIHRVFRLLDIQPKPAPHMTLSLANWLAPTCPSSRRTGILWPSGASSVWEFYLVIAGRLTRVSLSNSRLVFRFGNFTARGIGATVTFAGR